MLLISNTWTHLHLGGRLRVTALAALGQIVQLRRNAHRLVHRILRHRLLRRHAAPRLQAHARMRSRQLSAAASASTACRRCCRRAAGTASHRCTASRSRDGRQRRGARRAGTVRGVVDVAVRLARSYLGVVQTSDPSAEGVRQFTVASKSHSTEDSLVIVERHAHRMND